jgi:hypothetical protein
MWLGTLTFLAHLRLPPLRAVDISRTQASKTTHTPALPHCFCPVDITIYPAELWVKSWNLT